MRLASRQEVASHLNRERLASEYARMRVVYDQSNILDRDSLEKIGIVLLSRSPTSTISIDLPELRQECREIHPSRHRPMQ